MVYWWAEAIPWLILKVRIMLLPDEVSVVAVSMLPLDPRATRMVSGSDFDTRIALVGCVPVFDMPVTITFPFVALPVLASYSYAVTLARLDVKRVLPSPLREIP